MEYDLKKIVLDILKDDVLPLCQCGKDRFTPEDIAARYGVNKATALRKMNKGDFGEVINITARNKVVTLEGLLAYEAAHTGFVSGKPEVKSREMNQRKASVGRL